ncbi:hypothetical protein ACYOEI_07360 [Singulisphaera rosea]
MVPSSAAVTPTVIYKAQLVDNLAATFESFANKNGFGPNSNSEVRGIPSPLWVNSVTNYWDGFNTQFDPNAFATYRATVSTDLAGLWSEVKTMLAPLPRSKELIATIRYEMIGGQDSSMVSIVTSSLGQIQSLLLTGQPASYDAMGNAAAANSQQYHQYSTVEQAILGQVELFGSSRAPHGVRTSNHRAAKVNAQVDQAFATFLADVNALPGLQSNGDPSKLGPPLLAKINTLNATLVSIYTENKIQGNLLGALQTQVYDYSNGSLLQELTNILNNYELSFNVRQQVDGLTADAKTGVDSTLHLFLTSSRS